MKGKHAQRFLGLQPTHRQFLAIRSKFVLLALGLVGCATGPVTLNPYQQCEINQVGWNQVEPPLFREVLMSLPEEVTKKPVRELFGATGVQREVWFEDSSQNLQACLYNPEAYSRESGELHKVTFKKLASSWAAGSAMQMSCIH